MNCKTCLVLLSLIVISAIIGCGGDSNGVVVVQRPSVTWTSPQDGAESHRVEYVDSLKVINLYLKEILEPESTYTVVVTTGSVSPPGRLTSLILLITWNPTMIWIPPQSWIQAKPILCWAPAVTMGSTTSSSR